MKRLGLVFSLFITFLLAGCTSDIVPPLGGFYQSEMAQEYTVQVSIQPDDNTFVEYIDNREVDHGVVEKTSDDTYLFKGNKQEFEITLTPENSFEVRVPQMNAGEPIEVKNNDNDQVPTYFSTEFDDVEEYEALLNEKESIE